MHAILRPANDTPTAITKSTYTNSPIECEMEAFSIVVKCYTSGY